MNRFIAAMIAITAAFFCTISASAQEIFNLPAGSFYKVPAHIFEKDGAQYDAVCFSLMPQKTDAVFYLKGQIIEPYTLISREDSNHIYVFASKNARYISVGITIFGDTQTSESMKIKCINRKFSSIIGTEQQSFVEEELTHV